jgi:hypothetical protein
LKYSFHLPQYSLQNKNIEKEISAMRVEMAETRGAFRLAKFIISVLGLAGISSLVAWMAGQGK